MEQISRELLIKDLCARLPYGVKFACNKNIYTAKGLDLIVTDEGGWEYAVTAKAIAPIEIDFIKPYLFPLSSMTEEQFEELKVFADLIYEGNTLELVEWNDNCKTLEFWLEEIPSHCVIKVFDWLNKNHFDYRGLIPMGIAIDATGLNIY